MNERDARGVIIKAVEQGRDSVEDLMNLALGAGYVFEPIKYSNIVFFVSGNDLCLDVSGKTLIVSDHALTNISKAVKVTRALIDRLREKGRLDLVADMLNVLCDKSIKRGAVGHNGRDVLFFSGNAPVRIGEEYKIAVDAFTAACRAVNGVAVDAERSGLRVVLRGVTVDPVEPLDGEMVVSGIRMVVAPMESRRPRIEPIYVRLNGGLPLHVAIVHSAEVEFRIESGLKKLKDTHVERVVRFWEGVNAATRRLVVNASNSDASVGLRYITWRPPRVPAKTAAEMILRMYHHPNSMRGLTGMWRLAAIVMNAAVARDRGYVLRWDQVVKMQRLAGKMICEDNVIE